MAVKITTSRAALRQLMRSGPVKADLVRRANNIARAADAAANDPGGHDVETSLHPRRVRAEVATHTPKSMWKEAVHRTLTSSIDAGRR